MSHDAHGTGTDRGEATAAFGQGLPPAGGWKRDMVTDDEYSPEYQDEYRRLWHEAAAERDRYRAALERVYQTGRGPHVAIAREALDA